MKNESLGEGNLQSLKIDYIVSTIGFTDKYKGVTIWGQLTFFDLQGFSTAE